MRALAFWIVAYGLNALWQVPLAVATGFLAARLFHRSGPAAEHRTWRATLACAATLPACDVSYARLMHLFGTDTTLGTIAGTHVHVAFRGSGAQIHALPASVSLIIAGVYGCVLLGLALRLGWGCLHVAAIQRWAIPAILTGEQADAWARCRVFFRITDARLATTMEFGGPVLIGLRSRTLLVPQGFLKAVAPAELETAFAHEFAHMHRRDCGWNLAYRLLALPIAWHPATSLLWARLAESREMACDRMAAQAGSPVRGSEHYARSLLRLAAVLSDRPQTINAYAIGIFDTNTLRRRIMKLAEHSTRTTGTRKLALAATCTALALTTFASATAMRLHIDSPALAAAAGETAPTQNDTMPKVISSVDPEYPAGARADKTPFHGICIVGVTVSQTGVPQDVHVIKSLRADFDRNAVDAVSKYRFAPALRNRKPVAKTIQIEVNFQTF